jgi:hypothetical protein
MKRSRASTRNSQKISGLWLPVPLVSRELKTQNMTTSQVRNSVNRSPWRRGFLLIPLALTCFALSPTAGAAGKGPPTSGGVPNGMQEFTTVGDNGFVVPTGVTKLLVEVWGAGGGAGANIINCSPGGWGGAGAYSRAIINVTQGETLTISIGVGGGTGAFGQDSLILRNSTVLIDSDGGQAGQPATDCFNFGANGAPGAPDPNAAVGRTSSNPTVLTPRNDPSVPPPSALPASGTIEPIGAYGGSGVFLFPGGNGYVLIQW